MFGWFRKSQPKAKVYARDPSTFRPLAVGLGGCLCTDRITVDGAPVGYFVRETPNNPMDSGWCFFAGDESEQYLTDLSHSAPYDLNTIANHEPAITAYLDAPVGSAFIRDGDRFVPDEGGWAWDSRLQRV